MRIKVPWPRLWQVSPTGRPSCERSAHLLSRWLLFPFPWQENKRIFSNIHSEDLGELLKISHRSAGSPCEQILLELQLSDSWLEWASSTASTSRAAELIPIAISACERVIQSAVIFWTHLSVSPGLRTAICLLPQWTEGTKTSCWFFNLVTFLFVVKRVWRLTSFSHGRLEIR